MGGSNPRPLDPKLDALTTRPQIVEIKNRRMYPTIKRPERYIRYKQIINKKELDKQNKKR